MSKNRIKQFLTNAINNVSSNISQFSVNPEKDFTRRKKIPVNTLLSFLISEGSSSTRIELLDFFNLCNDHASVSALNQQRDKLKPEGVYQVMQNFNQQYISHLQSSSQSSYRYLAADGSSATFFSNSKFSDESYLVSKFDYPESDCFDIKVNVTLVRSHSKK